MRTAKRIDQVPPYFFMEINRKIAEKKAKGEDVISFAVGDPDLPTPRRILNRLWETAQNPESHRYPDYDGLPDFRRAIAEWYERRFGIPLHPDKEVLPLIGSKEGIGHAAFCFIDPGDIALVPDPAYPVYSVCTTYAGGEPYFLPLLEENNFLPDLESVPPSVAHRSKLLWINYPNNPTAAVADMGFFEKVVAFAKKYDLAVCHDAAYTEVSFDGYRPLSFLQAKGAREMGMEFHSLSKSYNMTGWRVAMAVGNEKMISALTRVKSNIDSGIPNAIQYAAIEALRGPQDCIAEHNAIYQRRRDKLVEALTRIGLRLRVPLASLYVWARLPEGWTSLEFAGRLLEDTAVVVTPGIGYGQYGEGYIRVSMSLPDDRLEEGVRRIARWQASKGRRSL